MRVSWGELRMMVLGGVLAGLAFAGWSGAGFGPGVRVAEAEVAHMASPEEDGATIRFGFCHTGGGTNCVVDGDTIWMAGEKIRIADIDTPETHPSRCAEEARLGNAATRRLHALLNAGPVTLERIDRDTDRYGRKLRIVTRGGKSLGDTLVAEGLARRWEGHRRPWC